MPKHWPSIAHLCPSTLANRPSEDTRWIQQSALQTALTAEVSALQTTREDGYRHTQPFRLVRNRGAGDRKKVEKENTSVTTQDLVRTMAEMIEQQPGQLFGYLAFLEIIFFPKHPSCSNMGNVRNLKKLKA